MEPDELLDASTLTFDPVRRAALDKLNTYFLGPISSEEAEHLNKTLYIFASERRLQFQQTGQIDTSPFTIFIDSPGGEVDAGLAIMNMVFRVQRDFGYPVHMVVLGVAYSMAVLIVQSGSRRIMEPFATMLVHEPSWALAGKEGVIFRDYEKLAEGYRHGLGTFFAERTGRHSAGWWEKFLYAREERFLFPTECLELGLVDEVRPAFVLDQGEFAPVTPLSKPPSRRTAKPAKV